MWYVFLPPSSPDTERLPGDYCDVADNVLEMRDYQCYDITEAARHVAQEIPSVVADHEGLPGPYPLRPGIIERFRSTHFRRHQDTRARRA